MVRALLLAIGLVVAIGAPAAADDAVFEILPVRNRPAADLVPPLEAMLGSQATVTAYQNRLIVRAPRSLLPEIRRLIQELDVRPRSLWITVSQGRDLEASRESATARVAAGPGGVAAGGSITAGRGTERGQDVHHLRVLEGTPAFISLGQSVPVDSAIVAAVPGGVAVVPSTTYQRAERGFWVVARLAGERVTLEIETALDETRPQGAIETQGVSTTVSGRLGEWLSLGEIGRETAASGSGILYSNRAQRSEMRTVRVKVEEIP